MRKLIGGLMLFAAGTGFGIFLTQTRSVQAQSSGLLPGLRLNHVGIYAKNYEESLKFYTQTLGFREAFTIKGADGKPTLTYLQLNRDQFIELAPASGDRQPGLSHAGIWPMDLNGTVAAMKTRGIKIDDPRTGATRTSITNLTDPNGIRLEFLDFLDGSLPKAAIDNWKP